MRLKYSIEFVEKVQGSAFLKEEVLEKVTDELRKHMNTFLVEGGFVLSGDILVNLELLNEDNDGEEV